MRLTREAKSILDICSPGEDKRTGGGVIKAKTNEMRDGRFFDHDADQRFVTG